MFKGPQRPLGGRLIIILTKPPFLPYLLSHQDGGWGSAVLEHHQIYGDVKTSLGRRDEIYRGCGAIVCKTQERVCFPWEREHCVMSHSLGSVWATWGSCKNVCVTPYCLMWTEEQNLTQFFSPNHMAHSAQDILGTYCLSL